MRTKFRQGYFTPTHPEKYKGNIEKIRYMSSWELSFHQFLDTNPHILQWSSEPFSIPYIKPTDGRIHRYYPDYWVEYKNKRGTIIHEIIEVKPESQTKPPVRRGKRKKTQITEQIMYAINTAKWASAQKFCDRNRLKFRIVTEQQLYK